MVNWLIWLDAKENVRLLIRSLEKEGRDVTGKDKKRMYLRAYRNAMVIR